MIKKHSSKWHSPSSRRLLSWALALGMVISMLPLTTPTAKAAHLPYGTQLLPPRTDSSGWGYSDGGPYDNGTGFESNYDRTIRAWYTYDITDARDIYRIDKGQYKLYTGCYYTSKTMGRAGELVVTFLDANNAEITHWQQSKSGGLKDVTITMDGMIPAGTRHIKFWSMSNGGSSNYKRLYPYGGAGENHGLKIWDEQDPYFEALTPNTADGSYRSGTTIQYKLKFDEPVNVQSGGHLEMAPRGTATYTGQNEAGDTLYYSYTIPAPTEGTPVDAADAAAAVKPTKIVDVSVSDDAGRVPKVSPNGTANIHTGAITMDNKPPVLTHFTTDNVSANASYKAGENIQFTASFHEYVKVTGVPSVTFSSGGSATAPKTPADATSTHDVIFTYTVKAGENAAGLHITGMNLSGITDAVGQDATESPTYAGEKEKAMRALDGLNVAVDTSAPTVGFNPASVETWSQSLNVALTPQDNISGLKNIWAAWTPEGSSVTWPGNPNVVLGDPKLLDPTQSGTYQLYVKAEDSAGNLSAPQSSGPYMLDKTPPALTLTREDLPTGTTMRLTAAATDSHAGVKTLTFDWKNDEGITTLSGGVPQGGVVPMPSETGTYSLTVTAADGAGNTSSKTELNIQVDTQAPAVTFTPDGVEGYAKSHSVVVTAQDRGPSGLASLSQLWRSAAEAAPGPEDAGWTPCASGDTLSTPAGVEGSYRLYIRAEDLAGNIGVTASRFFAVDNVPPAITVAPDGNASQIGLGQYEAAVSAQDATTAAASIVREYAVTDSATPPSEGWTALSAGQTVNVALSGANRYVHIRATDEAGNVSVKTSAPFVADVSAPTGTLTRTSAEFTSAGAVTVAVVSPADDYTAEQDLEVLYTLDGVPGEWESLTSARTLTVETEGTHAVTAALRDMAGNTSAVLGPVSFVYDKTPPQVTVAYSTQSPTGGAVVATATATDHLTALTPVTETTHTFLQNGSFTFRFVDQAGNEGSATAQVDWIDLDGPVLAIDTGHADGAPRQAVHATVAARDKNTVASLEYRFGTSPSETEGWASVPESGVVTLSGTDGAYTLYVRAADEFGNACAKNQTGFLLDNTKPTATVTYIPSRRTAQNVTASITLSEAGVVTSEDGGSHLFTDNGSFVFAFEDKAGNQNTFTAQVDWIDRTVPAATEQLKTASGKTLSPADWTNEDVVLTLSPRPNSVIEHEAFGGVGVESEDPLLYRYTLTEYGVFTYENRDVETQIVGEGEVYANIDREAPVVTEVIRSTEVWTNGDVSVTVTTEDFSAGVQSQTHVFTENGAYDFVFTDKAGNRRTETIQVSNIDKTAPVPVLSWHTADGATFDPATRWTNQNVTVTLSFPGEPATGSEALLPIEHTFTDNGSQTFTFTDAAGNAGNCEVKLERIDRTAPTGYVTLSKTGWTNQDVTATLHAQDDRSTVSSPDNFSHVFTQNGSHVFVFTDEAGNEGRATATAERIDKTPPVLGYTLSPPVATTYSVYATVTADEPVTYLNNGGKPALRFESNGSFTFQAVDRAGNKQNLEVKVNNISTESTPVRITYSTTEPTGSDVTAVLSPEAEGDRVYILNNAGANAYTFHENGEFTFRYRNDAGVVGTATASVTNIDKTAPVLSAAYSTTAPTNQDVVVTVTADKDVTWPYGCDGGVVTFTENAARRVTVYDALGNASSIVVRVENIDKTPPVITLQEPDVALPLGSTVDLAAGVTATDDRTPKPELVCEDGGFTTAETGSYTITYTATDEVGNTSSAVKTVAVYDPDAFGAIVNGKMSAGAEIRVNALTLSFSFVNAKGEVSLKYLGGRMAEGAFKAGGTPVEGGTVTLTEAGYYTFYAMDESRQSVLVRVFVR